MVWAPDQRCANLMPTSLELKERNVSMTSLHPTS
jgi:hypothetical protein